jgi:hypothetical protein
MLSRIIYNKIICGLIAKKITFFVTPPTKVENKSIPTIKTDWCDVVKRVFNFQFNNYCRKQIRFNLEIGG